MGIRFTANERTTIGVELETSLVDRRSGDLVSAATELLAELGAPHPEGEHPKAKHELFACTVELITGICRTVPEAKADLGASLAELQAAADRKGVAVMSAGTHPSALARQQQVSPSPRYRQLIDDMQWPARRLLIFGTHVHVGVPSGADAIVVANELLRHLPLLLALSAASPFFEGEDTGLASSRSKIFESLPTAGLPPEVHDWDDFEAFMDTLLAAGSIKSIREVWWDVRPHPDFGTVELRMCDAVPTLGEVAVLAALAQSLVTDILDRHHRGVLPPPPRHWTVQENRWLAARYGMDADLITEAEPVRRPARELLAELVEHLAPTAEGLGCVAELHRALDLASGGVSYQRQRRVVAQGGRSRDVVEALIRELETDAPCPPPAGGPSGPAPSPPTR